MQIYPIRNDDDYRRALKEIEPYFDNPPADYLNSDDAYTHLVEVLGQGQLGIEPLHRVLKSHREGLHA